MSERTTGLHRLITIPAFYRGFQDLLGAQAARAELVRRHLGDIEGLDLLEVGCGPGPYVPFLSAARSYLGLDWNRQHILEAQAAHGGPSVSFDTSDVTDPTALGGRDFDRVLAFGLLHHLSDEQVGGLLSAIVDCLRPDGAFLAVEPVYHPGQSWIARALKRRDSGQAIRTETGYRSLLEKRFSSVSFTLHTDLLRLPYSHGVFSCRDGTGGTGHG